jgi:hypothetical protein
MKKTIVLNMDYLDMNTIKKSEEEKSRKKLFKDAVKAFKTQMVGHESNFKIIKERTDRPEIIIEFDDSVWGDIHTDNLYSALIASESVSMIDSYIYDDKIINTNDVYLYEDKVEKEVSDLKDHLSKYSK